MIKKILILGTCLNIILNSNALAADLSSIVYDHTVMPFADGVSYVTTDGKLCIQTLTNTSNEFSLQTQGTYFDDIRALSSHYFYVKDHILSYLWLELPYYTKKDGTLWSYTLKDGVAKSNQIQGITNALEVFSIEFLGFALEKNGKIKYWNQVDPNPTVYEVEGLSNIVDISASTYYYATPEISNDPTEAFPNYIIAVDSFGDVYKILFRIFIPDPWWEEHSGKRMTERPDLLDIDVKVEISAININEECLQASATSMSDYILTGNGNAYLYDVYKGSFNKVDSISNAVYMWGEPFMVSPALYTNNNSVLMAEKAATGTAVPYYDFYNVTEFGKPVYVASGAQVFYVYEDGTMVMGAEVDHYYNDMPVESVGTDDPNKVLVNKTHLLRRYQIAHLLVDLYEQCTGKTIDEEPKEFFEDIDESNYKSDIEKCSALEIMNGLSKTEFSPNGMVTREQLAVILKRIMEQLGERIDFSVIEKEYSDNEKVSSWAKDSIGIIENCFEITNNRLAPDEYVTAEEFETILQNLKSVYMTQ